MSAVFVKQGYPQNQNIGAISSNQVRPYNIIIINNQNNQNIPTQVKRTRIEQMKVDVLFADSQELRNQYYELRQKCFREVDEEYKSRCPQDCLNWEDYDGSEMEDDRRGKILVAMNDEGKVVAGARFLLSNKIAFTANEEPWNNFTIRNFLEKKGYDFNAKYCEIDDIVIDRQYRNRLLIKAMFKVLIDEAEDSYCDYMIGMAVLSAARTHKMIFGSLGYKVDLHKDYPWVQQKNHGYETRYPIITSL